MRRDRVILQLRAKFIPDLLINRIDNLLTCKHTETLPQITQIQTEEPPDFGPLTSDLWTDGVDDFWLVSVGFFLLMFLCLSQQNSRFNPPMKRIRAKVKKKPNAKKLVAIRSLRGKYKHLNLMTAFEKFRHDER